VVLILGLGCKVYLFICRGIWSNRDCFSYFDNDHRDAYIRGMDAFDNDQWCLLQVYMVGSITTSAIYVLFDNDHKGCIFGYIGGAFR
jgi:hypothetical protein